MDITSFVVTSRESALLDGDFATYRTQLSRKLLNARKKLNLATKHRAKFQRKPDITPEQVAGNHGYAQLLLLTSERAWANAMAMKSLHSAEARGISGHTRSHIVSRLAKAAQIAQNLSELVTASGTASDNDILEARAYEGMMHGAAAFERHAWEQCLVGYSTARIVYTALSATISGDKFKDLLSETIDPSLRYAAYQLKTPRTVGIPAIAQRAFPRSDADLVRRIDAIDTGILNPKSKKASAAAEQGPTTLEWRSREVRIEDAAIGATWAAVQQAVLSLKAKLADSSGLSSKERAALFDEVLLTSQDCVDATKQAIDELKAEGVSESDRRMQSLHITRTAASFEMINWRISRNRALTGSHDGALPSSGLDEGRRQKKAVKFAKHENTPGRQLVRLKEKVVLYDSTLQSLETVQGLPGVSSDDDLSEELQSAVDYYTALKCLSIARSHSIARNFKNALALSALALKKCKSATQGTSQSQESTRASMYPSSVDLQFLTRHLTAEVARTRALADIESQRKGLTDSTKSQGGPTVLEQMDDFPAGGADLSNLLDYPPRIRPIAAKPIFLDVAWNYISYPSAGQTKAKAPVQSEPPAEAKPAQKKGWFSFGR